MSVLPPRTLDADAAKHFVGTPEERFLSSLRLGREALALFMATLPPGTRPAAAREILRRRKNLGRRPSRVMDGDPE